MSKRDQLQHLIESLKLQGVKIDWAVKWNSIRREAK